MSKYILVVDDDDAIRSLLRDVLEGEMYTVDMASNGLVALDTITRRQTRYDVILLDLMMPVMDGLQLIQLLRQRDEACLCSIIVLSADYEALEVATSLGVHRYLTKPFDLEMLLACVSACEKQPV